MATLFFAIALLIGMAGLPSAIADNSPPPTEEQRRALAEADRIRAEQTKRMLEERRQRKQEEREAREAAERLAAEELCRKIESEKYTLAPLLAEAMRERLDYEKRPRRPSVGGRKNRGIRACGIATGVIMRRLEQGNKGTRGRGQNKATSGLSRQ